jgi:hypothetical protein
MKTRREVTSSQSIYTGFSILVRERDEGERDEWREGHQFSVYIYWFFDFSQGEGRGRER